MKTININKSLLILVVAVISLTGCKKNFELSKPTYWPVIDIKGDEYVVVNVGDSYEDASADVTVNGTPIDFTTDSDVDTEETGVYSVTYTAVNEDGIAASQTRTVVVVDPAAADDDLSGTYRRSTNNPASVWAKDPDHPYAYISNNPGGVANNPPFNVSFTIYNVEPGIVIVPTQQTGALAPFYCTETLGGSKKIPFNVGGAVGSTAYAWVVNGSNFGTGLRTFVKIL